MDATTVKDKLIKVLEHIQRTTKGSTPNITEDMRPLEDLEGFDSKVWPVAISMLSTELGVPLPNDQNIFKVEGARRALTIDQTGVMVCSLIDAHTPAVGTTSDEGGR